MLAKRVVVLTYETVREWCLKFGHKYANELRLGEVFLKINDLLHYLWRAVESGW
jgi:putative transposase